MKASIHGNLKTTSLKPPQYFQSAELSLERSSTTLELNASVSVASVGERLSFFPWLRSNRGFDARTLKMGRNRHFSAEQQHPARPISSWAVLNASVGSRAVQARTIPTSWAAPLGKAALLGRLVYWERWMFRLGFRVYVVPSVVLAVFSCRFGAGLDVGKHVLSFSLAVLAFQWGGVSRRIEHAGEKSHPPHISSGYLPYVKKGNGVGCGRDHQTTVKRYRLSGR